MRFAKAHGLGNDFLLVADADVPEDFGPWARRLCDRHTGAGADGVLRFKLDGQNVRMWLINADGGLVELSGNGVRCLAAYCVHRAWLPPAHVVLTPSGPRPVVVHPVTGALYKVETGLGEPRLKSTDIPMALEVPHVRVVNHPVEVLGEPLLVTATSMGNPHCSVFLPQPPDDATLARLGHALEHHPLFPKRTNVEFVTVVSRSELRVRFWERGVGPTRSSGTGSAGAFVAAVLRGECDRRARVVCDGGALDVDWPEHGAVTQVGEVEVLYEAEWVASEDEPAPVA